MKYADFLSESNKYESNTTNIDIEEFKKIYAKLDNKDYFFRGIKDAPSDIMIVDGAKRFRKSIDDIGNYYTVLCDKFNPEYPKRSKGIMFTGKEESVAHHGRTYYLFPMNGAKIASAECRDMWVVKVPLQGLPIKHVEMYEFMSALTELRIDDTSHETIRDGIKKLIESKMRRENKTTTEYEGLMNSITTENILLKLEPIHMIGCIFGFDPKLIDERLKHMFDYENLNFKMYKPTDNIPRKDYEFWVDGKALIIDQMTFDKIKKDLD